MSKKSNLLGIILALVTGITILTALILKTFFPRIILPQFNACNIVLLSLVSLVADYYIANRTNRNYPFVVLYSALVFGIFPLVCLILSPVGALRNAVMGAVIFTAVTWLFDSMTDRLSSTPASKEAPLVSAFGLYLAAQCLLGIV